MKDTEKIVLRNSKERYNNEYGIPGEASEAINLRECDDALKACGDWHKVLALSTGTHLLAADRHGVITNFITAEGFTISLYAQQHDGENPIVVNRQIGTVNGDIVRCVSVGDFVVIYTTKGKQYIHFDGERYTVVALEDALPVLTLSAGESVTMAIKIPALQFATPYSHWEAPLNDADKKMVCSALANADSNITKKCKRMGKFTQPIVARWVVRLWDGTLLHSSAPVIIGNGLQPSQAVAMEVMQNSSGFVGTNDANYEIKAYGLAITAIGGVEKKVDALIKSIEIYYGELEDVTDYSTLEYRCETSQTGDKRYILAASLGSINSVVAGNRLASCTRWRMIACITDMESLRNAIVVSPGISKCKDNAGGALSSRCYVAYANDLQSNTITMKEIENTMWSNTHNTIPATTTVHDGKLYEGGGEALLRNVWRPENYFTGELTAESGNVYVALTLRGHEGLRKVVSTFYCENVSNQLSPLLSFPFSEAIEAEIALLSAGKIYRWRKNLCGADSGGMAYFVDADLKPISPSCEENDDYIVPAEKNRLKTLKSSLTTYSLLNPIAIQRRSTIGCGEIRGVATALRPVTANIFGRFPLYIFGTEGIYAASTEKDGIEPRCIDRRSVESQKMIAQCTDGIRIVSGDKLLLLDGTKVTTIEHRVASNQIAWNGANEELVSINDSKVSIYNMAGRHYKRAEKVTGIIDSRYAISEDNSVLDIHNEESTITTISYLSHPWKAKGIVKGIIWSILGNEIELTLTLYGDNGDTCHGTMLSQLKAKGNIGAPIWVPLLLPYCRILRIGIEGTVSPNMLLREVEILYKPSH